MAFKSVKCITFHARKKIRWSSLQWRHNERDGVSNHRRLDCLLNRLFRRRSTKPPKGNPPVTGGFPSQRASKAEMCPFDYVIMILLSDGRATVWMSSQFINYNMKFSTTMTALRWESTLTSVLFLDNKPTNLSSGNDLCTQRLVRRHWISVETCSRASMVHEQYDHWLFMNGKTGR